MARLCGCLIVALMSGCAIYNQEPLAPSWWDVIGDVMCEAGTGETCTVTRRMNMFRPDTRLLPQGSDRCFCTGCGDYFANDEAHLAHRSNSKCLDEKARRGAGLRTASIRKSTQRQWVMS